MLKIVPMTIKLEFKYERNHIIAILFKDLCTQK